MLIVNDFLILVLSAKVLTMKLMRLGTDTKRKALHILQFLVQAHGAPLWDALAPQHWKFQFLVRAHGAHCGAIPENKWSFEKKKKAKLDTVHSVICEPERRRGYISACQ